ncbi:hypothetical protein BD770DRAFT_469330 [Pilaira anomala]|nr:hypothetical protein BD770DRAFT_469330 [Pilaira anomala]
MRTGNVSFASINSSGLINFVQNFPNLTNLRIYCTDESNVDINQILGVAPYLQVLKLYDFETITCALQATKNGEIEENRHLAVLKLKAKRLDIVSLKHIATKSNQVLTHVVNFRLVVYNEMVPAMKFSSEIKTFIARIKSQNGNPIRRRRLKEDWTVKWWDIITMCPNLTSIYLDYDTSEIIAKLGSSEKKLKSIQKIQVDDIVNFPLDFHGLYVRANIRYYETITSLVISDWEQNPVVLEYGGLIELVSKFPQLTYLKVTHRKIQGTEMNLSQLLKASPKLQELEIYDIAKITSTDTAEGLEKFYLTKITLQADEISIKSLNYIITDLPDQVDNFCLLISKVKPDKSISEEESKEIINKLETLTTGIPRVDIQFEYKGKIFSIVTSEDSYICGSNIDDDALIGFYDCVDDPFLYDDEY